MKTAYEACTFSSGKRVLAILFFWQSCLFKMPLIVLLIKKRYLKYNTKIIKSNSKNFFKIQLHGSAMHFPDDFLFAPRKTIFISMLHLSPASYIWKYMHISEKSRKRTIHAHK